MAEITAPVSLCRPNGRLNPAAVGWTRRPLHTANLRGWGRLKRWEYWGLMTPRAFIGLTVSSLDHLGLMSIYVLDRRTGTESTHTALDPLARNVALAHRSGLGIAQGRAGDLALRFASSAGGVHITASGPDVDLAASVGPGQDSLGVVVPWSDRLFQYTVKDVARPVTGVLRLAGEERPFDTSDGSFAVLDHGRGRWPYSMTWNWAAGFGRVTGRAVGVQLGGKWTDATGSTENAVLVGGRMHRIHEDPAWHYDRTDSDRAVAQHRPARRCHLRAVPRADRAHECRPGRRRDPPVLRAVHRMGARRDRPARRARRPARVGPEARNRW